MTLDEIIAQLESCSYQCEAGALENNVAFRALQNTIVLRSRTFDPDVKPWPLGVTEFRATGDYYEDADPYYIERDDGEWENVQPGDVIELVLRRGE